MCSINMYASHAQFSNHPASEASYKFSIRVRLYCTAVTAKHQERQPIYTDEDFREPKPDFLKQRT